MNNFALLKSEARELIKSDVRNIIVATAAVLLGVYLVSVLYSELMGLNAWAQRYYENLQAGISEIPELPTAGPINTIISVLLLLASTGLNAGYTGWCLRRARGEEVSVRDIFPELPLLLKAVAVAVISGLFVYVGLILFIVPGIMLLYRYRFALYVLYDNPELSIFDCLRESGKLTEGRKMELFRLDLSFLGWYLAAELMSLLLVPALDLWVRPYTEITRARYYLELTTASEE